MKWLANPFLILSLGPEQFGVWSALSSVAILEQVTDLGMGNGLINAIATARGEKREESIGALNTYVFHQLCKQSLAVFLVVVLVGSCVDISHILSFLKPEDFQGRLGLALIILSILISTPLNLIEKVEAGYQEFHYIWVSQIAASLAILAALSVCFVTRTQLQISSVAALFLLPTMVSKLLNWGWYFSARRGNVRPQISFRGSDAPTEEMRKITRTGWQFFALNGLYLAGFSLDYILIGNERGGAGVTLVTCALAYCSVSGILSALLTQPLWTAYSEALAARDLVWCRKAFVRSNLAGLTVTLAGCLALHFAEPILLIRFAPGISISAGLLGAGYTWAVLDSLRFSLNTVLNGLGELRFQLVTHFLFFILATPLKIYVLAKYGVESFVWTRNVTLLLLLILPAIYTAWSILRGKPGADSA